MTQKDNAYWLPKEVDLSSMWVVQVVSGLTNPERQSRGPAVFTAKGIIDLPLDRDRLPQRSGAAHGEQASTRTTRRRMRLLQAVSNKLPRYILFFGCI